MPEAIEEVQERGALSKLWAQKMCPFCDTRKTRLHKNSIEETIRVLGLPTNTHVADNEATFLS